MGLDLIKTNKINKNNIFWVEWGNPHISQRTIQNFYILIWYSIFRSNNKNTYYIQIYQPNKKDVINWTLYSIHSLACWFINEIKFPTKKNNNRKLHTKKICRQHLSLVEINIHFWDNGSKWKTWPPSILIYSFLIGF